MAKRPREIADQEAKCGAKSQKTVWSKQLVYIGNANWGKGSLASGLGRLRIGGGVRMCLEESPALSDTCPGFL